MRRKTFKLFRTLKQRSAVRSKLKPDLIGRYNDIAAAVCAVLLSGKLRYLVRPLRLVSAEQFDAVRRRKRLRVIRRLGYGKGKLTPNEKL